MCYESVKTGKCAKRVTKPGNQGHSIKRVSMPLLLILIDDMGTCEIPKPET